MRTKKTVEKVMIPRPPIWKRNIVTTWPKMDRSCPKSMVTNPVTHTAEVEMKRASTKERDPWEAEMGNPRRMVPTRIKAAKPKINIRSGVKNLDTKLFGRIFPLLNYTLIGMAAKIPPRLAFSRS
jgi:hypothetical protein